MSPSKSPPSLLHDSERRARFELLFGQSFARDADLWLATLDHLSEAKPLMVMASGFCSRVRSAPIVSA